MHDFFWLISWWKWFSIPVISLSRHFVFSDNFVLLIPTELHSLIFEITQNYTVILLKVIRRKETSKISQFFTWKHKINESNAEVPTHCWIVCLNSKNVSFYVFIPNKFFNFFRNISNPVQNKAIQCAPTSASSSGFIASAQPLFF